MTIWKKHIHLWRKKTHSFIHEFKFWSFIQASHLHCKMYALSNITNLIDINLFCWCKGKAKHTRQIERVNRNDNRTSRMRFRASSRGNTCMPAKERGYVRACLRACMCVCELACTCVLAFLRAFLRACDYSNVYACLHVSAFLPHQNKTPNME